MKEGGYDAIVIGSGPGGLTAAAGLSKAGKRVLVLEQHFAVGGNAQTFRRRKMFDFDVGIHYLGDCGPDGLIPTILRDVGAEGVEFLPMDQDGFDTLRFPDLEFRVPAGWERYRARLHETFPQEGQAVDRFVDYMQSITKRMAMQPAPEAESLERRMGKDWLHCTLGDVFDSLECSLRLRHVLAAQNGVYAAPWSRASAGMHALVLDHYLQAGGYFPRGGSRAFVAALVRAIEAGGGEVRTRSRVRRLIVQGGAARGVELASGQEVRAPVVISNADAKRTLLELVGEEHLPRDLVRQTRETTMALPLFVIYLVMAVDPSELGIPNTNFFLFPAYNMEEQYEACYAGELPDRPGVYVSLASVKDPQSPNIAPPGHTNLQLMSVAPAQAGTWGVEGGPASGYRYRHGEPYVAVRRECERRILGSVEEMMPGFIRNVVWQECATPLTQERFTLSTGGTSYGLEHTPGQFFAGRFPIVTGVPGLYLVGASTIFGHGIAGTMLSGRACAQAVLAA